MKFNIAQIRATALDLLEAHPSGIRFGELTKKIHQAAPDTPRNTVDGGVYSLLTVTDKIARPSRGLWMLKKFAEQQGEPKEEPETATTIITEKGATVTLKESDFYDSFSNWLKEAVGEVTESMVLGGSALKGKWGTPDVIGAYKPKKSDAIQFALEIVSAEIKLDSSQSVTAFGQACAYRLFSHKVFIAMPENIGEVEKDRLEALCVLFGIGLVLFRLVPDNPEFRIVVTPQRSQPDMFYTNQFAERIRGHSRAGFDRLF